MSEKTVYVKPSGNAGTLRIIAVILWILGIICEVLAILTLLNKMPLVFTSHSTVALIAFLLIDLILVIAGSLCWKRANKIDPPSEKNKAEFFIKTQLGAIITVIAFFPILLFLLNDKNMDKKTKTWVSILAAVCLMAGVGASIDYNPISSEDLEQMIVNSATSDFGQGAVKWSVNSKVYHTWETCSALHRIEAKNLNDGVVKVAFESGKVRMCYICADHFHIEKGVETKKDEPAS